MLQAVGGREVEIGLTPQELDLTVQALGQLPYFQVAALIQKYAKAARDAAEADRAPPPDAPRAPGVG